MSRLPLLASVFLMLAQWSNAQKIEVDITANILADGLVIKDIPAFVYAPGRKFKIYSENISLKSRTKVGFEFGGSFQTRLYRPVYLTFGALISSRDFHIMYRNKNFLFEGNDISIEKEIMSVTVPVGLKVRVMRHLSVLGVLRTNLPFKTTESRTMENPRASYILSQLTNRHTSSIFEELAMGIDYRTNYLTIGVNYIRSVTPLETRTKNSYACLVPANLYFSSMSLNCGLRVQSLLRSHKERSARSRL